MKQQLVDPHAGTDSDVGDAEQSQDDDRSGDGAGDPPTLDGRVVGENPHRDADADEAKRNERIGGRPAHGSKDAQRRAVR